MNNKNDDISFKELRKLDNANSKDAKMNTPKPMNQGVSLMPHDEETLKTFRIKEMNFKDMTNTQKNVFIIIILVVILFISIMFAPSIMKKFGGVTIGNLRFLPQEKTEKEEDSSFAYEGDYIILGNNTTITLENVKFNNFTKGSDFSAIYSYTALDNINDVDSLNIYIEFYNYSKTLLSRFKFTIKDKKLEKGASASISNTMSENAFNKVYYVRVRVISEQEIINVPDPDDNEENDDPSNPSAEDPSKVNNKKNPNELTCTKVKVDSDLRISETFFVKFKNDKWEEYVVTYKVQSIVLYSTSKKYSKYYKEMLKKYKTLVKSEISDIDFEDTSSTIIMTYTVRFDDYYRTTYSKKISEAELNSLRDIEDDKKTYKLEIGRYSNRTEAKSHLEKDNWLCD